MARWERIKSRGNVVDRRGMSRPGMAIGGLGGIGAIVFLLITLLGGGGSGLDQMMDQLAGAQAPDSGEQPPEFQGVDEYEEFASIVLGSRGSMPSCPRSMGRDACRRTDLVQRMDDDPSHWKKKGATSHPRVFTES